MASTYSTNLRLELIGTGEQQGTWGATTNVNLGTLLEEAIGGYVSVPVTDGADTVLTTNNGSADQARNMVINLTGTLSAARTVLCPAIEKLYVVRNATSGGFAVTFKVSGQTGVSIPNGSTYFVYVNGTDVVAVNGTMASQNASSVAITGGSITGITDLAVADGGTGASTAANARANLGAAAIDSQTFTGTVVLPSTTSIGNVSATEIGYLDGVTSALQTQIDAKAPLANPTFTGTPAAPTANAYTNTTQVATTAQVYATVTNVPENAQTGTTYTLVASDKGKMVTLSNASAITLTVPNSVFAAADRVDIGQYGAGQVTVAAGSGLTLRSSGSKTKLTGQYSGATIWFKSASEAWLIGDITT